MKINIRSGLFILLTSFIMGTLSSGYLLANHPHHLTAYVLPTLWARFWASNPLTAHHDVLLLGHRYASDIYIATLSAYYPSDYRQLMEVFTWAPIVGGICAVLFLGIVLYFVTGKNPIHHIRGRRLVSAKRLTVVARRVYGKGLIAFGRVTLPEWAEPQGIKISGSTGTGKTTAIMACLDTAAARHDRCIIADQNGQLMAHYMDSNIVLLLNPFDERGQDWSLLAEMQSPHDAPRLAKSAIPDAEDSASRQWTMYAQQLLAAVLERLYTQPSATNGDFLHYFRPEGFADLKRLIQGKAVSAVHMPGNERLAANVSAVLAMYLPAHEYLNPNAGANSFSICRWIQQSNQGWLWLPYMNDQLDALRPLIATWLDIASVAATSLPPVKHPVPAWQFWGVRHEPRRIWNVIDEVASIGRIQSLESSITLGRKAGLRTVIGMQSISQLRELYGRNRAETIMGSLNSSLMFGTQDPDTAEYCSRLIADAEVEITNTSSSRGSDDIGSRNHGENTNRTIQRTVLPAEISALRNLTAYVVLSGVSGVAKVKFDHRELLARIPPFVPKSEELVPAPGAPIEPVGPTALTSDSGPEFI